MATYFDYKKRHPHINFDDVYIKAGAVVDDKLVLQYSIEDIDPLSISLSAFDKMTYIDDGFFKDDTLVFKHNRPFVADLSISLSSLATDTFVTSCYVTGNNLVLERNNGMQPLVVDLGRFNRHISNWKIVGNDLVLSYNDDTPALSVALDRFHKHIDRAELDLCDQLTLHYADDVADPLSIDLSKYTRNYFVNEAVLCGDVIVLKRNSAEAGPDLSVDVAPLNNYIQSAEIIGKTLVLAYNSDKFAPLSIDISQFIKDYYISDVKLCADNKLHFKYSSDDLPEIEPVDLSVFTKDTYIDSIEVCDNKLRMHYNDSKLPYLEADLSKYDNHINAVRQDTEHDNITFQWSTGDLSTVYLSKYANNDLSGMYIHGDSLLVLKFKDGSSKSVQLSAFDKHIESYLADDNNLSLAFNNGQGCVVIDKNDIGKNITAARVEDRVLWLDYSDGSEPISAALPELPNMYVLSGKLEDGKLVLGYEDSSKNVSVDVSDLNDEYIDSIVLGDDKNLRFKYKVDSTKDTTVDLSAFDNELIGHTFVGNVLSCGFANGKNALIDLCKFDKFTQDISLSSNKLTLTDNTGSKLTVDLSELDKHVNGYEVVDGVLKFKYKNSDDVLEAQLSDINFELTAGMVSDNADNMRMSFSNGKSPVSIDTTKLNIHVSSAEIVGNKLKLNMTNHDAIEVDLAQFANELTNVEYTNNNVILNFANGKHTTLDLGKFNMFINNAYLGDSTNENKFVLTYNNPERAHLEVNLDKFDKYVSTASVADGSFVATYNNNKGQAFSIPLTALNYELTGGEVGEDNQLSLNFSNGKNAVVIDASRLKSPDTYISSIALDDKDNLVFDYNLPEPAAKAVCLHDFRKNDFIESGRYDLTSKKLVLNYNNQPEFGSRAALSIEIPTGSGSGENFYVSSGNYDEATDKLVLSYNTTTILPLSISFPHKKDVDINVLSGMYFKASDEKSILSIAQAIEQIVTAFGGNREN